jgi:2-polyprenyl-3-methyl-5-hydroxy-6-metoxy-1,4-benzoquinol methylase
MRDELIQPWPIDQLESVNSCPICGSGRKHRLESNLIDWMSHPPTGMWSMNDCLGCGVAYLSPRPVSESIGKAYAHYYTHTSDKDDLVNNRLRRVKDIFADKYYSVANGTGGLLDLFAYILVRLMIPVSSYLDAKSRHLFELDSKPGRLLDVGCGNGEFLKFARNYGWDVCGIDLDEHAVAEAGSSGLDVSVGGIEVIAAGERFDFISLSHVIEHVYDPTELVRSCYSLLNEGGTLWLETPNIEGLGHSIYKSNWRGFEPPRHLVLFNQTALSKICLDTGFVSVKQKLHGLSGLYMGLTSERLLNKTIPCGSILGCGIRNTAWLFRIALIEISQMFSKRRREFITLIATR